MSALSTHGRRMGTCYNISCRVSFFSGVCLPPSPISYFIPAESTLKRNKLDSLLDSSEGGRIGGEKQVLNFDMAISVRLDGLGSP